MKAIELQYRTIDVMRFAMVCLVVVLHSYTSTRTIIDTELYPFYRVTSFLFSLEFAQTAVPGLFFISGFLYYLHPQPYATKLRKTFKRLIIPYLLWNLLILAMYFGVENIPALVKFLSGENLPVSNYTLVNFLQALWDGGSWDGGNGTPILHQFWYIRSLILLSIFSPLIRLFVQWFRLWGIGALYVVWLFTPGQAFLAESIAFFALGVWFSLHHVDFVAFARRWAKPVYLLYALIVALHMLFRSSALVPVDRVAFTLGIIIMTDLAARFVIARTTRREATGEAIPSYLALQGVGFFLFAFHDPLLTLLKRAAMKCTAPPTDFSLTVIYLLIPWVVAGIALVVYRLLKRYASPVLLILTGR